MQSLSEYLSRWRLKLSTAKTTTTAFYLNNRDTYQQLDVVVNGAPLPNNNNPVYLGVILDRALTYRTYLESLQSNVNAMKVSSAVCLAPAGEHTHLCCGRMRYPLSTVPLSMHHRSVAAAPTLKSCTE